jgi:FixJ family two-component response regulator
MSHTTPIVFVVDDDVSVRKSLELLIDSAGWQPETFACAQDFLSCPRALAPNCLILDVTLPDINGLELQKRVAVDRFDMPIIFISGYGDVPMTVQAMKAGAVEFLTKPLRGDVLLSAIQHAIERSNTALEQEAQMQKLRDCYASLSRREREVMALVVSGLLNKQVGGELGISEITVKAHRGSVMRKMKADSLADLVNMAARLRLAPAPKGRHSTERSLDVGPARYGHTQSTLHCGEWQCHWPPTVSIMHRSVQCECGHDKTTSLGQGGSTWLK